MRGAAHAQDGRARGREEPAGVERLDQRIGAGPERVAASSPPAEIPIRRPPRTSPRGLCRHEVDVEDYAWWIVLEEQTIDALAIDDEASFRHVSLYRDLKNVLRRAQYRFRVLPAASAGRWDRALFLNLTFWGANDGGDVLVNDSLPADVVAHVAWHHLAAIALAVTPGAPLSAEDLFLGEAIASAFDVYLVGRLLGHSPRSSFLANRVPTMAQSTSEAGLSADDFETLLQGIADDPDRAFEDLRHLLFEATTALAACGGVNDALDVLSLFDTHRFASLIHHYEISNWVLYARAYAKNGLPAAGRAREIDRELQKAPVALEWLTKTWIDAR